MCIRDRHRYAGIQSVNVPIGHITGHRTAAAGIHLAQLGHLPDHTGIIHDPPDHGHHFGGGVRRAGFAPGPGIFAKTDAVIDPGAVALLIDLREVGVIGCGHVGREAVSYTHLVETIITTAWTVIAALIAWWKNNSFTQAALEGDKLMHALKDEEFLDR